MLPVRRVVYKVSRLFTSLLKKAMESEIESLVNFFLALVRGKA
jgi:hypothetical protein